MTSANKTLAVVGAGPGLGFSIAKRFGAAGFQVALLARNADKLVAELGKLGVTARGYVADVRDRPGLAAALARVEPTSAPSTSWSTRRRPAARRCLPPTPRPRTSWPPDTEP